MKKQLTDSIPIENTPTSPKPSYFRNIPEIKVSKSERSYNSILKFQKTANYLLNSLNSKTEEELKLIETIISIVDKNLKDPSIVDYLSSKFGNQSVLILENLSQTQIQIKESTNPRDSKDDIKIPPITPPEIK